MNLHELEKNLKHARLNAALAEELIDHDEVLSGLARKEVWSKVLLAINFIDNALANVAAPFATGNEDLKGNVISLYVNEADTAEQGLRKSALRDYAYALQAAIPGSAFRMAGEEVKRAHPDAAAVNLSDWWADGEANLTLGICEQIVESNWLELVVDWKDEFAVVTKVERPTDIDRQVGWVRAHFLEHWLDVPLNVGMIRARVTLNKLS